MKKEIAYSSTEYQKLFHDLANIDIEYRDGAYTIYENMNGGSIVSFGNPDTIQCGFGDYIIDNDFAIEYNYDTRFLHFGIVYEGITYSMAGGRLVAHSIPSSFMALEKLDKGLGVWRAGQHFQGVELSISYDFLVNKLLPLLDKKEEDINFLKVNYRYTNLSNDMVDVLKKLEDFIKNKTLTSELQIAYGIELVALILNPANKDIFTKETKNESRAIKAGKRTIHLAQLDIEKIKQVREIIMNSAYEFKTITMLAKEVGISEQKLKYGFFDYYKQTIWDFQNNVRMSRAVWLIKEGKDSFEDISKAVGYHSQTAFYNAFKNWCGLTPGEFKKHLLAHRESL